LFDYLLLSALFIAFDHKKLFEFFRRIKQSGH
jgi:hypothetical protein